MSIKTTIIVGASLALIGLTTSCDPLRTLTLETKKKSSSIKIYFKRDAEKIPFFKKASNPLEISTQNQNEFTVYFTIGYWDDQSIKNNLTQNIDSIILQTNKKKEFYKTPDSIQKFLKKKRKFFSKSRIEIKR